jgi:DNA-binding response OmpR family regulator
MRVSRADTEINLTPKEYQLLLLLARAKGKPVSKPSISDNVWDLNFETGTNTIEVYINFLRKKIDRNFDVKLIHTRPGFGYYLKSEE